VAQSSVQIERSPAEVVAELRRLIGNRAPARVAEESWARAPIPSGWAILDRALGGGLPRGRLVEVTGSAGRMSLALGALARLPAGEELAALIDPGSALDPRAAVAAGVDLSRLLWVRPKSAKDALKAADLLLAAGGFGIVILDLGDLQGRAQGRPKPAPGAPCPAVNRGPKGADGELEELRRMDHAWPRLAHGCERAEAALLVLGDRPLAGSFAAATMHLERGPVRWQRAPGGRALLAERGVEAAVLRNRLGDPGQCERLSLRAG
jgi:hypothetical protein